MRALLSLFLWLSTTVAAAQDLPFKHLQISGSLQLFQQTCDAQGFCELPTALSGRTAYSVTLPRPEQQVSQGQVSMQDGDLEARIDFFWRIGDPNDVDEHYVVTQITMTQAGIIIGRCSRYDSDAQPTLSVVGACSGASPDSGLLGVSMHKY